MRMSLQHIGAGLHRVSASAAAALSDICSALAVPVDLRLVAYEPGSFAQCSSTVQCCKGLSRALNAKDGCS